MFAGTWIGAESAGHAVNVDAGGVVVAVDVAESFGLLTGSPCSIFPPHASVGATGIAATSSRTKRETCVFMKVCTSKAATCS